jgi:hypothetical protein
VLYPNPAISRVYLKKSTDMKIRGIHVFDMAGRLIREYRPAEILQDTHQILNIEDLDGGIYTVRVTLDSGKSHNYRVILRK